MLWLFASTYYITTYLFSEFLSCTLHLECIIGVRKDDKKEREKQMERIYTIIANNEVNLEATEETLRKLEAEGVVYTVVASVVRSKYREY